MQIKKAALRRRLLVPKKTRAGLIRKGLAGVSPQKANRRFWRWLLVALLCLSIAACLARPNKPPAPPVSAPPSEANAVVVVWTTLPPDIIQQALGAYQAANDDKRQYQVQPIAPDALQTVSQLPPAERPQLVFAGGEELSPLVGERVLKPLVTESSDMLPPGLHEADYYWTGLWVDPYVLVVNRPYSRQVGQLALQDWQDILHRTKPVVAICDPIAVPETAAFFYAWASQRDPSDVHEELTALHVLTKQYSRFAATPVKMVGMGDSNVAVSLASTVLLNKDKQYPLYTYRPDAGAPVRVIAVAVVEDQHADSYSDLIDWLLGAPALHRSLTDICGWLPVQDAVAEPETAAAWWVNTKYLERDKQQVFMRTWLERVRFGK